MNQSCASDIGNTEWFEINEGVKQGSILSPRCSIQLWKSVADSGSSFWGHFLDTQVKWRGFSYFI